jgi:hypothetical protein
MVKPFLNDMVPCGSQIKNVAMGLTCSLDSETGDTFRNLARKLL